MSSSSPICREENAGENLKDITKISMVNYYYFNK